MAVFIALVTIALLCVIIMAFIFYDASQLKINEMEVKEINRLYETLHNDYISYNSERAFEEFIKLGYTDMKEETTSKLKPLYKWCEYVIDNCVGNMDRHRCILYIEAHVPGFYDYINSKFI